MQINDSANPSYSQTCAYIYDDLARLASVDCGSGGWGQSFSYDVYGNITKTILSGHTGTSFNPGYGSGNHVSGFYYDGSLGYNGGAGNVTNDGAYAYGYDVYGRPVAVGGTSLVNDAFGRSVEWTTSGASTQAVYDGGGRKFAFMNGSAVIRYIDPMVAGMAAVGGGPVGYYQHADWLGSSRFGVAGGTGAVLYDRAYAPYGEVYDEAGNTTTNRNFTGQTQDTASGLYDFLFRQQSAAQGRWLVPDPAGLAAVDITNPQTWNRYAYVANNPLSHVDLFGLSCEDPHDGTPCNVYVTATVDPVDTYEVSLPEFVEPDCTSFWGSPPNCTSTSSIRRIGGLLGDLSKFKFHDPKKNNPYLANNGTPKSPYSTGCSVAASCGPTANTDGFSHCTVTVGQNGKYTAYDGGPTGHVWNSTLNVWPGPGEPPGPNTFYLNDSCTAAACVPRVAKNINNANMWYSFPFQNSNSAAGMMLSECGMNVSLPVWGPQ